MKNLILVDGHSLAYRMYFALERTQMHTVDKFPTWGVYGFFKALFDLLKQEKPEGIVITFDVSRESFRTELYPDYKAHRKAMPDSLRVQLSKIREGIDLLGIPVFELQNYEADDLIGTLARQAASQNIQVSILTGDQDAFQIIDDDTHISVLLPGFQGGIKRYAKQDVFEKLGIYPHQVTDFKGLKGDSSDNIPGIPGIGDKTAAKLLAEYQTLENVLDNAEAVSGNKLRQSLIDYKAQALLSKKLATIQYDAPVEFSEEACRLQVPHLDDFLKFLTEMEFKSFLTQRDIILKPFKTGLLEENPPEAQLSLLTNPSEEITILSTSDKLDLPHHEVTHQLITDMAMLQGFLEKIKKTGVMAIDIETSGLDCLTAKLAGVAISWSPAFYTERKPAKNDLHLKEYSPDMTVLRFDKNIDRQTETVYIPIQHLELNSSLSEAQILTVLKPVLEAPDVTKIIHNAKYETNVFRQHGIFLKGLLFDTMIASYVLNTDRRHGLKSLAYDVLHYRMREITELIGKGKSQVTMLELRAEEAAAYAACDAEVTLAIAETFLFELDDQLESLLYEVELPLVSVLADMEWNGVSIDEPYLKTLSNNLAEMLDKVEKEIYEMAGVSFNLNSPKQVGDVLFEKLKIPSKGYTPSKAAFSTSAKVLESLAVEYPIVQKLLDYRQLFKLKSTYIDSLPQLVSPVDKRLHTSFNQTVAGTGRLSSTEPNLQNIPIRSELGRSIRQGFVPRSRDNWSILSADYSQIELRLLAHFSEDPELLKAFNAGEDIHQATAALVFDVPLDEVTKEMRYKAKAVNFGIIYGQTAYGLSQGLKIPFGEAADFIERYFQRYPKVKAYIEGAKADIRKTGLATTLLGRRRNFSEGLHSQIKQQREFAERAAFNMPLQGSAADLLKVAMIRLHNALQRHQLKSQLIIQVHDELVLEVLDEEKVQVRELVHWAMALDQPLKVPLEIDLSEGPTWMEA